MGYKWDINGRFSYTFFNGDVLRDNVLRISIAKPAKTCRGIATLGL